MTDQEKITLVYDDIKPTRSTLADLFIFGDEEVWLPKSQITVDEESQTLDIPLWLAEEKEIEGYEY
jgi:tRNA(Leu) C34 or U34 (ribose-2'-O)-methylase TrmL